MTEQSTEIARVRMDYGVRIDCARNGCEKPHGDDGMVLPRGDQEPVIESVNGHAVTAVVRTVTYSTWRDVLSNPPGGASDASSE